jgi:phosphatidyl-myo-inositol alpha-mannosyltransferase
MKIGMVSPYGWDTPGGVQIHIKELAEHLIDRGHEVSVLAPVTEESSVQEDYVISAGRPIPVPYNGAVARILFGPIAASRVRQWITQGEFDLLHLHEPYVPSLSLLACWSAEGPMVGTFHVASSKQKVFYGVTPILEPILEKLSARIAVSELARSTLKGHIDTEAVVIPNGISSNKFTHAAARPEWKKGHTLGFLGRFTEPRKGLSVLLDALPTIAKEIPDIQLLVAGPGDQEEIIKKLPQDIHSKVHFLGRVSEEEKASLFASVDLYVAPNTGGESFGIILAEAMAAGCAIVASDIPAFDLLTEHGESAALFPSENSGELARIIITLLKDPAQRSKFSEKGRIRAQSFEWETVANQILHVYEMVQVGSNGVTVGSAAKRNAKGEAQ